MNRWAFPNPFKRNHCVPVAIAHLAGTDAAGAVRIAERAYETERLTFNDFDDRQAVVNGVPVLLTRGGSAHNTRIDANVRKWGDIGGLKFGNHTKFFREESPTLARFCREHRTGMWLVFVANHAVAVIRGRAWGYYGSRSRVQDAYPAERVGAPQVGPERRVATRPGARIGDIIKARLAAGDGTRAVLAAVFAAYPQARTTAACVAWYRNQARKKGSPQ